MIAPARTAAYEILTSLSSDRSDLPTAIARARESLRDDRDRALAAEIATGVQRWRATLDWLIERHARRPLGRLDVEVVNILRLSLYQLLHLTRVPASAIVDDAVAMTKRAGKTSASGFVNAVLRRVSRTRSALSLPTRPADARDRAAALDYLSITLSHPHWLAARWLDRLGLAAAEEWMAFNNRPAPLTLRANTLRASVMDLQQRLANLDVETLHAPYAPLALTVSAGHPLKEPGVESGLFVVQDEASQLVALLAGENPGRLVLDACASPGGKTTAIAAASPGSLLVATDVRQRRIAILERTVRATGAPNVRLAQVDLSVALPFAPVFDTVIVDAPCSGLGTLRRDPDIKWRRTEADLPPLAALQRGMLAHAAAVVRPGGRLIYATCSSEPEENEQLASEFLRHASDFSPVDARRVHPSLPAAVVDERGHLRTSPDRHGLEAFFGAVFERRQ